MSEVIYQSSLTDSRWQRFRDGMPPWSAFALILLVTALIPALLLHFPMVWIIGGVVGLIGLALTIAFPFFGLLVFLGVLYLRPEESFPALTGARMALTISGTACFAWAINGCLSREKFCFHLPSVYCFLGFLTVAIGSTALCGAGSLGETATDLAKLLILFVLIVHLVNSPARLRAVSGALVLFTTILGVQTIWKFMQGQALVTSEGDVRAMATGIFGDPNDLALAMAMAIPLALGTAFGKVSAWTRLWNLAAVPLLVWTIFVTDSRGGMLAVAAAIFIFMGRRLGRTGMIVGTVAVVLMFALGPSRMRNMSSDEESAQGRVTAWEAGMEMLKSSPVWGVGKGQFVEHHNLTAHNSLVLCLAETGFTGTALWLGLFYFAFRDTRRAALVEVAPQEGEQGGRKPRFRLNLSSQSLMIQVSLVAFVVGGFFLSRTYTTPLYVYLALAIASARVEWPAAHGEMPGATGMDWLRVAGLTIGGFILIQVLIRLWG